MLHDPKRIEAALPRLVGLPLCLVRRSAEIQGFHFGALRDVRSEFGPYKGQISKVGEYVLHVQCAWRVVGPSGLVVGSGDVHFRAGDDPIPDRGEIPGTTRADERLASVAALCPAVTSVRADEYGGLAISLASRHRLEVFPDDSLVGEYAEYWRAFPALEDGNDVVMSANGVHVSTW